MIEMSSYSIFTQTPDGFHLSWGPPLNSEGREVSYRIDAHITGRKSNDGGAKQTQIVKKDIRLYVTDAYEYEYDVSLSKLSKPPSCLLKCGV